MRFTVTDADTAIALGSGDLPVLGTPRLIAWMERAAVVAIGPMLPSHRTSVGTAVTVRHRRPTPVGGSVDVLARPVEPFDPDAGRVRVDVTATDGAGEIVGAGTIDRAVVDRAVFLAAVPPPR
jgi:predicted thioesterase